MNAPIRRAAQVDTVPAIRRLHVGERVLVAGHLLRLDHDDRRMRFCGVVGDAAIRGYAGALPVLGGVQVGWFQDQVLRGVGELRLDRGPSLARRAELALSVEGPWQRRGVGRALAQHVIVLARNRGVESVRMQCLAGNRRMLALARALRVHVTVVDGEAQGMLVPGWPSPVTLACECVGEACAALRRAFEIRRARAAISSAR